MDWGYLEGLVREGGGDRVGGVQPAHLGLPGAASASTNCSKGHARLLEGLILAHTRWRAI